MDDGAANNGRVWTVPLTSPGDVSAARRAATAGMLEIGATVIKRTKFVTAVSEVARNALVHGGGGYIRFTIAERGSQRVLVAECVDRGPGVDDIEQAMLDGYTSKRGLGLGLGGAKRLVDRFEIRSSSGTGTVVRFESGQR